MADVKMPQLGMSMTEGDVVEWLKRPGDPVQEDEPLVAIESAKASDTVKAPASGTLTEIVAQPGTTVPVGGLLARIDERPA